MTPGENCLGQSYELFFVAHESWWRAAQTMFWRLTSVFCRSAVVSVRVWVIDHRAHLISTFFILGKAMYKHILGALVISIAFAGCSEGSGEQAAEGLKQSAKDRISGLSTTPVSPPGQSEFPSGFVPDFAYQIRSKKIEDRDGDRFRKLVIEFQYADAKEVDKRIESHLSDLGYRRYKAYRQPNGALVGDYGKGGDRITATTIPIQPDMKLLNHASRGTVYFAWKEP